MEIEVKLPELGDGIKSGDILEVLVQVGDEINRDQGLLEVETDKATVTLPSTHTGKVKQIHVQVGQTVKIGATLVTLETTAPATAAPEPKLAAPAAVAPAAPPQPVAPPPAPPAPPVAPVAVAPAPPTVAPVLAAAQPVVAAVKAAPAPVDPLDDDDGDASVAAGPAIRRFAREVGVDLRNVRGTGEHGRITREDVLDVVRQASQVARGVQPKAATAVAPAPAAAAPAPAPETAEEPKNTLSLEATRDNWGPIRVERMTKIRRTIAAKMHESWTTVPRVTNLDDADITDLERIRQVSKDDYAARGIKLTSLPFVIKSVAMALKNHPLINASIDLESGSIIYKNYVNIGIAVDSERGLVVPSLRNADQLSIPETARHLATLAEKVRDSSFAIDDLRGSTFTISNLGAVGGTYSTPIINTPEVAILLVGRARKMPVVVNDEVVPRLMMPLSLSYDHRLVDGAAAARFLNEVIGYLTAPSRLLLAP